MITDITARGIENAVSPREIILEKWEKCKRYDLLNARNGLLFVN